MCHKKQRADLTGVKNQMKLVSGRLEQQEGQREQEERTQRVKAQAMAREPGQEVGRPALSNSQEGTERAEVPAEWGQEDQKVLAPPSCFSAPRGPGPTGHSLGFL